MTTGIVFEEICEMARETMLRDGYHSPILLIGTSKGDTVFQFQDLPASSDERQAMFKHVGENLAKSNFGISLECVYFITEVWQAEDHIGTLNSDTPFIPPSQRPDRKEALMLSGHILQPKFESRIAIYYIIRAKDGKRVADLIRQDQSRFDEVQNYLLTAFISGFNLQAHLRRN